VTTRRTVQAALTIGLVVCTFWVWIANRGERRIAEPAPRPDPEVVKETPPEEGPAPEAKTHALTGLVVDALGGRPVAGAR